MFRGNNALPRSARFPKRFLQSTDFFLTPPHLLRLSAMRAVLTTYRNLLKQPTFFCAVVFTLTLGIGANSAIFSVIDAVLLKPLPYPNSDRLMALFEANPRQKRPHEGLSAVHIEEWNRMNQSFSAISG